MRPDDRAYIEGSLPAAIRELSDWRCELRVVWPDASVYWIAARGSIYRTVEGKATRMLGIVMDVAEREIAAASLRASEQLARGHPCILIGMRFTGPCSSTALFSRIEASSVAPLPPGRC